MLLKIREESSDMFLGDIPNIEDHCNWLNEKINDPNCKFYVIDKHEKPIGYIRCEKIKDGYDLSYGLLKKYQGLGYGTFIVGSACTKLKGKIIARIKQNNMASIKVVVKNNFILKKKLGNILVFERVL